MKQQRCVPFNTDTIKHNQVINAGVNTYFCGFSAQSTKGTLNWGEFDQSFELHEAWLHKLHRNSLHKGDLKYWLNGENVIKIPSLPANAHQMSHWWDGGRKFEKFFNFKFEHLNFIWKFSWRSLNTVKASLNTGSLPSHYILFRKSPENITNKFCLPL